MFSFNQLVPELNPFAAVLCAELVTSPLRDVSSRSQPRNGSGLRNWPAVMWLTRKGYLKPTGSVSEVIVQHLEARRPGKDLRALELFACSHREQDRLHRGFIHLFDLFEQHEIEAGAFLVGRGVS